MKQIRNLFWVLGLFLMACQPTAAPVAQTDTDEPAAPVAGGVLAEGRIVPLQFTNLAFQTGGVVAEILVAEGDAVQVGDPLIQLEDTDVQLALAQAEARLNSALGGVSAAEAQLSAAQARVATAELLVQSAEAQLTLIQAGPRPEEVEAAEKNIAAAEAGVLQASGQRAVALTVSNAQIEAARAQVAAAQADYTAVSDAYNTITTTCFTTPEGEEVCPLLGPTEESTRQQLRVAELSLAAAQAALDQLVAGPTAAQQYAASGGVGVAAAQQGAAEAQLALLQAGASPEQIRQVEVGVEQARLGIAQAEAAVVQAEAGVVQAQAAVTTAEAAVAQTEAVLGRLVLTAVQAGTVSQINIEVGELASPGVPVVTVADFSQWLVETTDLTELDVAKIEVGGQVQVQVDAIPGETLQGTVTKIGQTAALSQGDVVYQVTLALDPAPNLPLRWGMTVFVEVE